MFYTEKEIFSQYQALEKTLNYLKERKNEISEFIANSNFSSLTFIGSGSSYCLCQSAEMSSKIYGDIPANALAAGDLMLNYPHYKDLVKDTLLIAPSRSGSTSEVIKSLEKVNQDSDASFLSISATRDSKLSSVADFSLEIPWAFDESVCQTRTVTNLYLTQLFLIAVMNNNESLIEEIEATIASGPSFIDDYKDMLKNIGEDDSWEKVVVLGDSELQGIASEAAIAFKEIPQVPSNYYHILDVRHGPMVMVDDKTLVIMACSPFGLNYQTDLVKDLQKNGAQVVTVGDKQKQDYSSDYHVSIPTYNNYGVMGIPFIFVPQVIALNKAIVKDINPDEPESLDPWIKL